MTLFHGEKCSWPLCVDIPTMDDACRWECRAKQVPDWEEGLLKAAPDMLEALRELLDIITEHDKLQYAEGSPIDRTITRARQIIAKAEGKP